VESLREREAACVGNGRARRGRGEAEAEKRHAQALQRSFSQDEGRVWATNELPLLGLNDHFKLESS
jgi:hypothetical protein